MSIYAKEVVRVDGDLKAYITVQNEYTGATRGRLCTIHLEGNTYYAIADGQHVNVNDARASYLARESKIKAALDWYAKTKF